MIPKDPMTSIVWLFLVSFQELPVNFIMCCIFRVDRDRSGFISADELQMALSNGTW